MLNYAKIFKLCYRFNSELPGSKARKETQSMTRHMRLFVNSRHEIFFLRYEQVFLSVMSGNPVLKSIGMTDSVPF